MSAMDPPATVTSVTFGIGWDGVSAGGRAGLDLDLSAFALDAAGAIVSDQHFVFFNNAMSPERAIVHAGLPSAQFQETMTVHTGQLGSSVRRVVVGVTAYNGEGNFGRFSGGHIAVSDSVGGQLADYDLYLHMAGALAVAYGEVYRDGGGWRFRALGERFDSLGAMAATYGVNV
ncbi:putative tellurium resistance protein [Gordonia effusa NBRC 100432]|uniref:Putative tellurium resistance protein n=1 Tax=Gordonia effusa NBRC 100432 TaxID=1077974 RepID=H0R4A5_9ACTN|nr:TerD family protein [Gordonia effusa]GAB19906.1 putative tellurium resistance protein [Gordonia effusa NBRC 100432]